MKKIFLFSIALLAVESVSACEFCGCSTGNYFIGPFPQFQRYFVGTRYTFRKFDTSVKDSPTEFSHDFYQTVEVWGGVNLGKKWQVLGFIPYSINRQSSDDGVSQTQGLGDMTFMVNYSLFKITRDRTSHELWLGSGIKLPTGAFSIDEADLTATANNQPGSGSVDYLVNTLYVLRVSDWGVNSSLNYKINQSANGFQFGDRFAASAFLFKTFTTLSTLFNPNVGLLYENLAPNQLYGAKVAATGGSATLAAIGLETSFKRMTFGFNAQVPLSQHFSDGQTETKVRGMVHVTYTF